MDLSLGALFSGDICMDQWSGKFVKVSPENSDRDEKPKRNSGQSSKSFPQVLDPSMAAWLHSVVRVRRSPLVMVDLLIWKSQSQISSGHTRCQPHKIAQSNANRNHVASSRIAIAEIADTGNLASSKTSSWAFSKGIENGPINDLLVC